jgi:hypothetical protein
LRNARGQGMDAARIEFRVHRRSAVPTFRRNSLLYRRANSREEDNDRRIADRPAAELDVPLL